jgi:hypothetical protein
MPFQNCINTCQLSEIEIVKYNPFLLWGCELQINGQHLFGLQRASARLRRCRPPASASLCIPQLFSSIAISIRVGSNIGYTLKLFNMLSVMHRFGANFLFDQFLCFINSI